VSVTQAAARRGNDGMNGLPKVWRSDLQPTLEMLSRSVIINDETEHIFFAKHVFLETLAE